MLLVLLVLLGGVTAYWWVLTERMAAVTAQWLAARRGEGWAVEPGRANRGGWPLAATLTLDGAAISRPGGLAWSPGRVVIGIALIDPTEMTVSLPAEQTLREPAESVTVRAREATATASLLRQPASGVRVTVRDAVITPPEGGTVTVGLTTARWQEAPGGTGEMEVALEAITVPPVLAPRMVAALGQHISSLSWSGTVTGRLSDWATWRASRGVLEVTRAALGWGPLGLSGSGTATGTPDAPVPEVTGTARLVGYNGTLDALARSGAVPDRAAATAKAFLGLGALTGGTVDVPFTVHGGVLTIAGMPLLRLAPEGG